MYTITPHNTVIGNLVVIMMFIRSKVSKQDEYNIQK